MKHLIRKCSSCGAYTLSQPCKKCGGPTIDPHPPRYSPDDKYVRYRVAERYSEGDKD
ncbi:MAG: RNA-protein complex protein Nop10 [Nitrososphaera sp.]|jgi:H/ACA ribonucleoprotein complex subunit 3